MRRKFSHITFGPVHVILNFMSQIISIICIPDILGMYPGGGGGLSIVRSNLLPELPSTSIFCACEQRKIWKESSLFNNYFLTCLVLSVPAQLFSDNV